MTFATGATHAGNVKRLVGSYGLPNGVIAWAPSEDRDGKDHLLGLWLVLWVGQPMILEGATNEGC